MYSKEGATTTKFIFGNGILLSTVEGNGTATSTRYYHQDHLGGTNVVTDSMGTIRQVLDYYPYGNKRLSLGSHTSQRQFIGEMHDPSTDLNYLNARFYDNSRGQFLSQDPVFWRDQNLANPQSLNSYSYAENNPINKKDPTGLKAVTINSLISGLKKLANALQSYVNNQKKSTPTNQTQKNSIQSIIDKAVNSNGSKNSSNSSQLVQGPQLSNNERFARSQEALIGKTYVLGACGPSAFDCSGAVIYGIQSSGINQNFGKNPDYTAHDLYKNFAEQSSGGERGTVNFYDYTGDGRIDHVTTNIGNGRMVNPLGPDGSVIRDTTTTYLDAYTRDRGGIIYSSMQLNWSAITQ